jgi:hypothetical protein
MASRSHGLIWLIVVAATAVGCGGSEGLVEVTGIVRLDGKPLPGAQLTFVPTAEKGSSAYGQTDEDGHYRLRFSRDTYGAQPGKSNVRIAFPSKSEIADLKAAGIAVPPDGVKLPKKYDKAGELTADIPSGGGTFDFDLKSE